MWEDVEVNETGNPLDAGLEIIGGTPTTYNGQGYSNTMFNYNQRIILLLIPVMLVSCAQFNTPPTQPVILAKSSATTQPVTKTETAISFPMASPVTPELPQATSTPLPSPTSTFVVPTTDAMHALRESIPVCPGNGVLASIPDNFELPGVLIYNGLDLPHYQTIGGTPLLRSQFLISETGSVTDLGISPNGQWFAYAPEIADKEVTFQTPYVVLLSATGQRIESTFDITGLEVYEEVYDLKDISGLPGSSWINDHLIYLSLAYYSDDPLEKPILVSKIFDPFTGAWVDEPLHLLNRFDSGQVGFSPDMSMALYEAKSEDHNAGVELRELATGKLIWSAPRFISDLRAHIFWSPDSSWVATVDPQFFQKALSVVSKNGEARLIADARFLPLDVAAYIIMQWSPNSQYLAIAISDDEHNHLYIYDVIADQYLYSCPLDAFKGTYLGNLAWSPDSAYVAVSDFKRTPLQVIKVKTGEIFELVQNAYAIGWSDKFSLEHP